MGASELDITTLKNVNFKVLSKTIRDINAKVTTASGQGFKTFVFVYYAGHGGMKNGSTVCVLNEEKTYPLEV